MSAYHRFIDELVEISARCVTRDRIIQHGTPTRQNERDLPLDEEEQRLKSIFSGLGKDDRKALADAFLKERTGAIHDIASFLEWATVADDLSIRWKGEDIGPSPYNTMHADFISRASGDDWNTL
ncbi:MAG: hypothetical protein RLN72_06930 [Henriciella sp.]